MILDIQKSVVYFRIRMALLFPTKFHISDICKTYTMTMHIADGNTTQCTLFRFFFARPFAHIIHKISDRRWIEGLFVDFYTFFTKTIQFICCSKVGSLRNSPRSKNEVLIYDLMRSPAKASCTLSVVSNEFSPILFPVILLYPYCLEDDLK